MRILQYCKLIVFCGVLVVMDSVSSLNYKFKCQQTEIPDDMYNGSQENLKVYMLTEISWVGKPRNVMTTKCMNTRIFDSTVKRKGCSVLIFCTNGIMTVSLYLI